MVQKSRYGTSPWMIRIAPATAFPGTPLNRHGNKIKAATLRYFVPLALFCVLGCADETEPPEKSPSSRQDAAARISETALATHFLRVRMASDKHRALNGAYPSEVEQLVDGGLLRPGQELDPWDRPYLLSVKNGALVITSLGPDGAPGGGDDRVSLRQP